MQAWYPEPARMAPSTRQSALVQNPEGNSIVSEHQRETDFLRQIIRYDESTEHDKLEERITSIQRDERCIRRAVGLMALLTALGVAGLCYAGVFLEDLPEKGWPLLINMACALGLASLISFVAFAGYWLAYRRELNRRREECRQVIMNLLECRLGKRHALSLPGPTKDGEIIIHRNEIAVSESEPKKLSKEHVRRQGEFNSSLHSG